MFYLTLQLERERDGLCQTRLYDSGAKSETMYDQAPRRALMEWAEANSTFQFISIYEVQSHNHARKELIAWVEPRRVSSER